MKRRGVIVCLAFAVFSLLTLPSISAVESNTILEIKKSFSNKTPEQITEQIKYMNYLKLNNSILITILVILLDLIAIRLIKNNYTEVALLIIILNLFIINKFILKNEFRPLRSIFLEMKSV